jgi:two-component system NtrC family sensor kinase
VHHEPPLFRTRHSPPSVLLFSRTEAAQAVRKLSIIEPTHAEKLEAVSTFAAGVAHEVKNPLQTVILGVDYLSNHVASGDGTAAMVLEDMGSAVMRADGIIRGLLEFSSISKREVKEEDLTAIVEQALQAVEGDLLNYPVRLVKELGASLPPLRFDAKTMKHVFINLFTYALAEMPEGGQLLVRTFSRELSENMMLNGRPSPMFKAGEVVVGAEVQETLASPLGGGGPEAAEDVPAARPMVKDSGLGLTVLKKIIELYGGVITVAASKDKGNQYTILFKAQRKE